MPKPPTTPTSQRVVGKLESVACERHQYKPYAYSLLPENVYVELELEPDMIVEKTAERTVVNLAGFKLILSQMADAVDELHDAYVAKARRAGKPVL